MASIKLGSIVSDIRGVIGGTVFSRNAGGSYAKQRTVPTNPNSNAQQKVRSIMGSVYAAWAALSAAVRADWEVYARAVSLVNRLGDAINVSGFNMYARSKAVFDYMSMAFPAAAPTVMTLAEQDDTIAITPSAGGQTISIAFDNTLGWAGEVGGALLCYQGLPQNPTVNSYDGPFALFYSVDGAVVPPVSPKVANSKYTIAVGQKCFMQFRILRADGRLSTPFRKSASVGA
jgi:hypothetical protein